MKPMRHVNSKLCVLNTAHVSFMCFLKMVAKNRLMKHILDGIMQHFYNTSFANVDDFFESKQSIDQYFADAKQSLDENRWNKENRPTSTKTITETQTQFIPPASSNPQLTRRQAGVEDLTKSSSKKWMMIAVVVLIVGILLVMMR